MSNEHAVEEQGGVSFHSDQVKVRSSDEIRIRKMGKKTLQSFHRVLGKEGCSPPTAMDFRNVFSSLEGGKFVEAVLAREVSEE